ncbi:MAG: leucine-rich repeat protein [Alistipes sp.]|nr:leucine-rich repeat protein [Alistipes sp.]MBR7171640.1 leucine-rich repeat protein [Prevotella sp.]
MKKLFTYLLVAITMIIAGCSESFDDSKIWDKLNDHESRIAKLEELCKQMNTNISSLQTIVEALQNNDYVTGVTPITKDGETIGYTITFTKSQPITIYHGKDGKDGQNGTDGKDGVDGKDGSTPIIGVKQDTDNIYYWTLNGEWLLDANGNKIKAQGTDGKDGQDGANGEDGADGEDGKDGANGTDGKDGADGKDGVNGADGKDGITPQLKIENDYWYISYDNGTSWTQLGKATGEDGKDGQNGTNGTNGDDGKDGDSFFQSVDTSNSEYVVFTLADGTQIQLPTWYAFEQLRTLCNQMNTNITSLQSIVNALQNNDYISSCTPLMEDGVQIGYTITFAKSGSIVIYHGKDGINGIDGATPIIGAKYHTDNILYWTINGEWLLDENGERVPVHGKDGENGKDAITPQLKIEDDYWCISYDNGATWQQAGKATGEDGDAFFQSVTQDEDYVYLTLSTGEQIDVPKHHPLSVTFTETEDIRVLADKTYTIGYTITGADDKTVIKALAQDGFRAVVKKTDNATGVIEITTPSTILPTEILVFVTDGKERTIMHSINFVEGVIIVSSKSYTVDYAGGTVQVPLSTNIDYTVEIPEADKSWISVAETRVVMRDETLTFTVEKNETLAVRYTMVKLIDALGVTSETILISQRAGAAQSVHVATAGTLESFVGTSNKDLVEELTVTGNLNFIDFEFIKTMSNLQLLDLSGLDNTTLPASCLEQTTIPTVLLPWNLTAIPNRAFYQSGITSIYIPETVQTIGEYAFYQCQSIKGDLVIPDATTSIGDYCFQNCTFDGTLTLGEGVQTIGESAFTYCSKFTGDLVITNSVTTIGKYAFYKCSGFTGNLMIGDGVVNIDNYAFQHCSGLSGNIVLGNKLATIGVSAFEECSSLVGNLVIPDSVTSLEYNAFLNCTSFQGYLLIGAGLTELPYGAFAALEDDSELYTPLNFSAIYCKPSNLTLAYRPESMAGIERRYEGLAFGSTYNWPNCMVYVPTGCKNTYVKQYYRDESSWPEFIYPWEEFAGIEEIEF